MNNRKVVPGAGVTHLLSTIFAKMNRIEKLLSPNIENLPDSKILDSKGVHLLTKMFDRTLLRRRNDGALPFHRDKGKIYYRGSDTLRAMLLEKEEHSKNKRL
ncbi:DNA-binding protein [Parabacteroides johnsonii]|uniref:DNA-binding protein n=1 Tax=Parabacteroides johnsonii TaxID=387661 RepID=UPI00307E010D